MIFSDALKRLQVFLCLNLLEEFGGCGARRVTAASGSFFNISARYEFIEELNGSRGEDVSALSFCILSLAGLYKYTWCREDDFVQAEPEAQSIETLPTLCHVRERDARETN